MSVRIYEISKLVNRENKEILDILRERGFEVKSASSTIDNISAEALIEELKGDAASATAEGSGSEETTVPEAKEAASRPAPSLPSGIPIVKSKADLEREKQLKAEAEAAERESAVKANAALRATPPPAPKVNAPPPPPATKAPAPPPPMPVGKAPAPPPPKAAAPTGSPSRPPIPAGVIKSPVAPEKPVEEVKPAPKPTPVQPAKAPAPVTSSPTPPPFKSPVPPLSKTPVSPTAGKPTAPPPASQLQAGETADETPAPAEGDAKPEVKVIHIKPPIVVRDFAQLIDLKPFRLISELMDMGIFASMNQTIEEDVAIRLAERHGCLLEVHHRGEEKQEAPKKKAEDAPKADDPALMEPRPPVVCVLGHVDHGKTTLLDSIRKANVVSGEAGGITQHIGAYQVDHNGHKITFLDTPGHAAFSKIRERGANVTDIAILVVAADDGFMPQTDEALKFAQKANVPVVVAINKMDAKGANIDRVKQQMQERNIAPEDWGGETLCVPVSAIKGEKVDELLEQVLLQAEISELKANPKCPAEGIIIESQVEQGRGPTATIIVQRGTLKQGDAILCGPYWCKVRAMMDEQGKPVKIAPPSTPVRILGWSGAPDSGMHFEVVKNEKTARNQAEENEHERKKVVSSQNASPSAPADLESLLSAIDSQQQKLFKVIVKADVHGSVEALAACLEDIKSDKVKLEVVESGVGLISKNDISLASTAGACVVGFNVKMETGVLALAKHHDVSIIQHNIIYELINQVRDGMAELLDPEFRENKLGAAEVRQKFPVAKGIVAGCMVTEGLIKRDAHARVFRKGDVIHESKISTLRRFKDEVGEVRAGYECGIQVSGFNGYEEGDVIECFEILEFRPSL